MFLLILKFLSLTSCTNEENMQFTYSIKPGTKEYMQVDGKKNENMFFSINNELTTTEKEFLYKNYTKNSKFYKNDEKSAPFVRVMIYNLGRHKKGIHKLIKEANSGFTKHFEEKNPKTVLSALKQKYLDKAEFYVKKFEDVVNTTFSKRFYELNDSDADLSYLHTNHLYNLCLIFNFVCFYRYMKFIHMVQDLKINDKNPISEVHTDSGRCFDEFSDNIIISFHKIIMEELQDATVSSNYVEITNFYMEEKRLHLNAFKFIEGILDTEKQQSKTVYESLDIKDRITETKSTLDEIFRHLVEFHIQFIKYKGTKIELLSTINDLIKKSGEEEMQISTMAVKHFLKEWPDSSAKFCSNRQIHNSLKYLIHIQNINSKCPRCVNLAKKFYKGINCFYLTSLSLNTTISHQLKILEILVKDEPLTNEYYINPNTQTKMLFSKRATKDKMIKKETFEFYLLKIINLLAFYEEYVNYTVGYLRNIYIMTLCPCCAPQNSSNGLDTMSKPNQ